MLRVYKPATSRVLVGGALTCLYIRLRLLSAVMNIINPGPRLGLSQLCF